jgi:hypothetical protein
LALSKTYSEALWEHHLLRLVDHALWVLTAHGVAPDGPFPLVCAACGQAWPCPLVTRVADWTLVARWDGLLDEFGVRIGDDVAAIIERWHRDGLAVAAPAVVGGVSAGAGEPW